MSAFNLPAGCTMRDVSGDGMPRCRHCNEEHNPEMTGPVSGLCPVCRDIAEDREWYESMSEQMSRMLKIGQHGSEHFRDVWAEMEAVKNQYGGQPPPAVFKE